MALSFMRRTRSWTSFAIGAHSKPVDSKDFHRYFEGNDKVLRGIAEVGGAADASSLSTVGSMKPSDAARDVPEGAWLAHPAPEDPAGPLGLKRCSGCPMCPRRVVRRCDQESDEPAGLV